MSSIRVAQELREFKKKHAEEEQRKKDIAAKKVWGQPWNRLAHLSLDDPTLFDDIGLQARGEKDMSREELRELCANFKVTLRERGYELLHFGKFEAFLSTQYQHGRALNLQTLTQCFDRLISLGALSEHEVSVAKQPTQPPAGAIPDKKPTLDDIETMDTSTRSGAAAARELVDSLYFGKNGEAQILFTGWKQHLADDYNFVLNEQQQKIALQWFVENRKSFLRYADWDACRRFMVRKGYFRADMLTEAEKLADQIEHTDLSRLDFAAQAKLKDSLRQVHGQSFKSS